MKATIFDVGKHFHVQFELDNGKKFSSKHAFTDNDEAERFAALGEASILGNKKFFDYVCSASCYRGGVSVWPII